ncbi:MAG: hypothetical protein OSB57_01870 [Planctomycetota bacterium]|nr:hypothetical protein [Planctomycetota bacterium]
MDANAEDLRSLKWLLLYQIKRAVRCDAFGKAQALADLFNTLEYGQPRLNASDPLAVDETSERLGAGTLVETEVS